MSYSDGPARGQTGGAPSPPWLDDQAAPATAQEPRVSVPDRHPIQPGARPYAHIAPGQLPAVVEDERPGWITAVGLSLLLAVLVGFFLGTADDQVVSVAGTRAVTVSQAAYTGTEIVSAAVATFIVWLVILRALFALLSIEASLRRR